jgi:hypothetical protein
MGKLTGPGPRELLRLEDVAKFQNIVNEVRERAVCVAAKVMNANRTAVTKGREEAENDITFIVKNKSMPSACMHTSNRITYYARG